MVISIPEIVAISSITARDPDTCQKRNVTVMVSIFWSANITDSVPISSPKMRSNNISI